MDSIRADGRRLEYRRVAASRSGAPTLVLLHEGLGCVAMWRDFPEKLAQATGCGVFAYSRAGYGGSDPIELPRPLDYMEHEAQRVLPEVLAAAGIDAPVLLGHSDGGSIALMYAAHAASRPDLPACRGLVLAAPHVFCEDVSVQSIARARDAYEHGDLRARLQRHHQDNVDVAFWGWNRAWLDPGFRTWNIERFLPGVCAPVLLIQGTEDEYGTAAQLRAIERGTAAMVETHLLAGCGHAPHRDQPAQLLALIADFVARLGRVSSTRCGP